MAQEFIIRTAYDRDRLLKFIREMDFSRPIRFEWRQFREKRSLAANATQHMWYGEIATELRRRGSDTTADLVKDMMKHSFLGYESKERVNVKTGEKVQIEELRKTRDLDKGESCFYMDQVAAWAVTHGIMLTIPEDSEYAKWQSEQNS